MIKQRHQVGAPDPGDVDPRVLQGVQQRVVDRIKEVDPLDGFVLDPARLGEPVERTHPDGEVVEGRQMCQVAAVTAEQYLAQVNQAVDAFLTGARSRVGGPCRCSTFRWCLKKDTSLVVVSMRSIWPNLSYILSRHRRSDA